MPQDLQHLADAGMPPHPQTEVEDPDRLLLPAGDQVDGPHPVEVVGIPRLLLYSLLAKHHRTLHVPRVLGQRDRVQGKVVRRALHLDSQVQVPVRHREVPRLQRVGPHPDKLFGLRLRFVVIVISV